MSFVILEGEASDIRTDTTVYGSVSRGKGSISSATMMNFSIDGKAVFADCGEQINIRNGDRVRVAGEQKSNGLRILAFHNLTNSTHGENGGLLRLGGYICIGMTLFFTAIFLFEIPGLLVILLPLLVVSWIILKRGNAYKKALKACL